MKASVRVLSLIVLFSFALGISASPIFRSAAAAGPAVYAKRRAALMEKIGNDLMVIQGAEEYSTLVQFRQDNNFYYLTGIDDTADAILVLDGKTKRSLLFLPPFDANYEKWFGHRLNPGKEATERTGITESFSNKDFDTKITEMIGNGRSVYISKSPAELGESERGVAAGVEKTELNTPWDKRISRVQAFSNYFESKKATIKDVDPILDEMRRLKGQEEIELMRESSAIGSQGHIEVIKAIHAGMYEYEIAALAEYVFKRSGAIGPSYFPIAGSGPNSCALHYSSNNRKMKDGDIVVFDFAPDYGYYASDITRTFPVSGKFTDEQRKVYEVVLAAQKAGIAAVKPGATMADVTKAARDIINAAGYGKYWAHGIGHYVGMGVHDVGSYDKPFEPGVVLTVEPGIYIPEKELGVRIEDVVLVTKDGREVLSNAPKEIDEIEKLMTAAKLKNFVSRP